MNAKKPFSIDKSGQYGDVTVECTWAKNSLSKRGTYQVVVLMWKGKVLLTMNGAKWFLRLTPAEFSVEEASIVNDALRQMGDFRSLMVVNREGQWFIIVNGRRIRYNHCVDVQMLNGEMYVASAFDRRETFYKKFSKGTLHA
jgi:hypothetical protein